MSAATPDTTGPAEATAPDACAVCGAPLKPDQEWCLECGTGRTIIHRPPDWRIPVLVVGTIIVLAVVGFIVALARLGGSAGGATSPPTTPSSASPSGTAVSAPHLAGWPAGLDGWTIVIAASPTRSAATAAADRLTRGGLSGLGVLDSSQHPAMRRTHDPWQVFDGRYPRRSAAAKAARTLDRRGQTGTKVVEVAPPGGI